MIKTRKTLYLAVLTPLFLLVAWVTQTLWLPLIYQYLDMGQLPLIADLIIIPGGSPYRAEKGAQLYKEKYAPKILISGAGEDIEITNSILKKQGVPVKDITIIRGATNTWDEAVYNLQYLRERKISSVLIVTDTPHTRRLRAVYASLNIDRVGITVISSPLKNENTWWRNAYIRDFVLREYVKMFYYFLRYDVWSWS